MKKWVNLRFPVIFACILVAGIALGYVFIYYGIDLVWLTAVVPSAAVALAVAAIAKIRNKFTFFIILSAFIVLLIGFFNCYFRISAYQVNDVEEGKTYTLYGKVIEKGATSYNEYLVLDNVSADGQALSGRVIAYLPYGAGENCDTGYTVRFQSTLNFQEAFPYGKLNYNAEENIKYSCNVTEVEGKYGFTLFGSVRSAIRNTLFNNLSSDTAAVCYAMLTGNTQDVESDVMQSFRYGGIAHIFAVSGLHIGIIFGIASYVLKKLRLNKYVSAAVCLALIFFYSGVCGFTLSSVRAAIMCTVVITAKLFYKKYDGLNALSVAAAIILLVTPLSLFDVGFQLSVCAVGCIFCLSNNLRRGLQKLRVPKKISSAIGTSLGAQLGTLPVMLANFGYLSGAGLLLNIVFIPLLSALFVLLFCSTLTATVIGALAPYIMPAAALPLELIISFLVGTSFESALISGFGAGLFIPVYFIGILAISDKINLKSLTRVISVVTACAVLTVYVLCNTFYPFDGYKIVVSAFNGGGEIIIKSRQGTVLIITDYVNSSSIMSTLNKYYSSLLDGVVILGGEDCALAYGKLGVDCSDVYVYQLYINLQPYENTVVHYESDFTLCGIDFEFIDGYNILLNADGISVGVSTDEIAIGECNLLISERANAVCDADFEVYFDQAGRDYSIYEKGDLSFSIKGGELFLTGIIPKRN